MLGLITGARARLKVGDVPRAVEDADSAVKAARSLGDPTVLIDALIIRLDAPEGEGHARH
jgi:hypothetical protein